MCKGLTHKGLQCRSREHADYCRLHLDQTPIALYTPPDEWPSSYDINHKVSNVPTLLTPGMLREHFLVMFRANAYNHVSSNRLLGITCIEILKNKAEMCLADSELQLLVVALYERFKVIPELAAYLEDFKRKCLESHRAAARKRVLSFYFKRCEDLCDDVIEKVLECV
jgi:hypothetical protein